MTSFALLPLVGLAAVCLLVVVLSAVYVWSGNAGRRTRSWHVLQVLLRSAEHDQANDA